MEREVSGAHKRRIQGVLLTKTAPGIQRVIAETSDLYRSKSVSGLPLKSEFGSQIEKKLQEAAANSELQTRGETEDSNCQVKFNKKVDNNKQEVMNGAHDQECSMRETQTQCSEVEEFYLEQKKDRSTFVEIDLRDTVEEIMEDILIEEKQPEKEEGPQETVPPSPWLCCFPNWTKWNKQKEKTVVTNRNSNL
ncbi:hypothetical protein Y1Q_0006183 [Alligator mississippiensis]|uniref:Uncharacterized protein n=1 Tax=Alligator mississippiensis TaxID=8496 RepID=A0A151NWU0_ALLMI|nr:hypothetical protein Y1Q_0006183 [Alligator mississippiensis]